MACMAWGVNDRLGWADSVGQGWVGSLQHTQPPSRLTPQKALPAHETPAVIQGQAGEEDLLPRHWDLGNSQIILGSDIHLYLLSSPSLPSMFSLRTGGPGGRGTWEKEGGSGNRQTHFTKTCSGPCPPQPVRHCPMPLPTNTCHPCMPLLNLLPCMPVYAT